MKLRIHFLLLPVVIVMACRKESTTPATTPANNVSNAVFTLSASGSVCGNATVQGQYAVDLPTDATNRVVLQINVTTPGKYVITTSMVNGFSFSDSGMFTSAGVNSIVLKATGSPTVAGNIVFPISTGSNTCSFTVKVSATAGPNPANYYHMLFGNPSNAAALVDSVNNFLMQKEYYALSYSRDRGIPNWVSWYLYAGDLGSTARQNDFRPDNSLPSGWLQVPSNAYSGSGFDRGHNIPSADRTISIPANSSTFFMTNMIPQAPYQNQQTWAKMEDSLRRLVSQGFELYIIMGNYGAGGTGSNGFATTLYGGNVTVPAHVWKIAVVLPTGDDDIARVNANTRIIAVSVPNANNVNANWKTYRTSVDAIEAATGYDLLNRLPPAVQAALEQKVDNL